MNRGVSKTFKHRPWFGILITRKPLLMLVAIICGYVLPLSAAPAAGGTARLLTVDDSVRFMISVKVHENAKPGVSFYPMIRIVLEDGTWIDGALGCFPTGIGSGQELGGDAGPFGKMRVGKKIKRIDLVGKIGDPDGYFRLNDANKLISPLDDKTLEKLKANGGFVISIPVTSAK